MAAGVAQVDLGRTACALSYHEVVLRAQPIQRFGDDRPQVAPARAEVVRGGASAGDSSANDNVGAAGLGFEQNGIHVHRWFDTGGNCLRKLSASDLTAVSADRGVVRHVLRLERPDREAAARERPA